MERTLLIFKPDAVQRRLVGRILSRFEDKGFKIVGLKLMQITEELAARHYHEHKAKPFYSDLVQFVTAAPSVVGVLQGPGAIEMMRKLVGATFGPEAAPGTIRGDFGFSKTFNLVHGSDSAESARREIELFFKPDDIVDYPMGNMHWIVDQPGEVTATSDPTP